MSWKKSLPNGMRDRLFREAYGSAALEAEIMEVLKKRGYQRIETPSIEFEDVFNVVANQDNLYRFYDGQGRTQVLRPDMTLPIGRVIATTGVQLPLQLAYSGKIFRDGRQLEGMRNELTQIGIEIVGYPSIKAELECLLASYSVMQAMQISHVHFELGHAAIVPVIEAELNFSVEDKQALRQALSEKNISTVAKFVEGHPSEYDAFLKALPMLFGDIDKTLEKAQKLLPRVTPILQLLTDLQTLAGYLTQVTAEFPITVDLGTVAKKDYYTGIIFNAYGAGIAEDFLSGGRYDRLLEKFEMEPTAAVGVALNLDALIEAQYELGILPKQAQVNRLIFTTVETFCEAQQLITETTRLALFDTLAETKAYAKRWQIPEILVITELGQELIKVGE
ncbi:ATP phosphoribosyltransferase regulatory subunit [Enterococcus sp. HY326]|uniref:ATP phosphoribosyltransferase regulatory subunit n=1 Tax=Enterococcus sp. HY326 TaxID=2971265 RepID=UPI00223F4CC6|nr:ATP phosphoribosyltransferase regulatory subunit [Enterococcus sp. HY326]